MPKGYRRSFYIEDLYIPEKILDHFNRIHFENVSAFMKATGEGFLSPKNMILVNIHDETEFKAMKSFIEAGLDKLCNLSLIFKNENYFHLLEGIESNKFQIIATSDYNDTDYNQSKIYTTYKKDNPIWKPYTVKYANFRTIFDQIIDEFQKGRARLAYLNFDYTSFHDNLWCGRNIGRFDGGEHHR